MNKNAFYFALGALALAGTTAVIANRSADRTPGDDVRTPEVRKRVGMMPGPNLLFNGWGVTPAGTHALVQGDMPLKMVLSPDGKTLLAALGGYSNMGLTLVDVAGKKETQFLPLARAWNGIAFSGDGRRLFVSGGISGVMHVFHYADGKATFVETVAPTGKTPPLPTNAGRPKRAPAADADAQDPASEGDVPVADADFLAGVAVHSQTGKLYVANEGANELWVLNGETLQREAAVSVGARPHTCVVGKDSRYLYVSNWGGRSVSVVDTQTNKRLRDIPVGIRPNDMALGPDGRLFVACAGDNSVHVITTARLEKPEPDTDASRPPSEEAREIIATSLYPSSPEGSTPDGVAVSPDGKRLYVANADNNAVCVVDISRPETSRVEGFVPAGWYPTAVAVSDDSKTLFIAQGKGLRSRASWPPQTPNPRSLHKGSAFDSPGRTFQGAVSILPRPEGAQLALHTEQVRKNSPYTPETLRRAPMASDSVIPDRVGAECPIKYVLYIIKENRTYDQILGDLKDKSGKPLGNGEPRLVFYGEDVTPNHHQLAREYVLLDNLYCNGEVSRDGHSWCDNALATDFNTRAWIQKYSGKGFMPGGPGVEGPVAGSLWNLCQRQGVSFRSYGEGTPRVPTENRGDWPKGERDMNKVEHWIADLKKAENGGAPLPQFMIMSLGEDHTKATRPGAPTPEACVASNDIGLGKIVAAASRSKFWKEMAIFVIEDDAQNGPDHVDSHRTVGFVISPFVRRGTIDSTLYTTTSMIRTMELILGLPPLTQYDAGATPMFRCFSKTANVVPYTLLTPKTDVNAKNKADAPGAQASLRMNFAEYDDLDRDEEETLNRILWRAAKGPNVPYAPPIHRAVLTRR